MIGAFQAAFFGNLIYQGRHPHSTLGIAITIALALINLPLVIFSLILRRSEPEYQRPLTKWDAVVMSGIFVGLALVIAGTVIVLRHYGIA